MKFVPFYEHNDHEGEEWVFWLQLDGNEDAIARLEEIIDAEPEYEPFPYQLDPGIVENEYVVDKLVEHGGQGYMDYQNKVTGKFVLPEGFELDDLYKGGIENLFK